MTKPFHTNVYRHKQTLVFRGRDEYGKRVEHKERFQPTIFLHPTSPEVQDLVSDGWKSITGHPRVPFQPGSMWDTKQFVEEYTQVADNAHTPPEGTEKHEHAFLGKYYGRQDADWNPEHIDICYLDIETTCEQGFPDVKNPVEELLCLTLVTNNEKAVLACRPFEKIDGYKCIECASERELLERVCHFVQQIDPDILTGWNSKFFDIPYLVARIERVLGEEWAKKLAPSGYYEWKTVKVMNRELPVVSLKGRSTLDYLDLYKKYTYHAMESYKLDYVAWHEVGEQKLDYGEYDSIEDFYTSDFSKFVKYNVRDVELVQKIDSKKNLLNLHCSIAYMAKINYEDAFSPVATWEAMIANHLRAQKICVPPEERRSKSSQYAGAYVKDPVVGFHNWVVSFDLNSLYPSLILQKNISPETLIPDAFIHTSVDKLLENPEVHQQELKEMGDVCLAANGWCFDRTKKGFIPELVEKVLSGRKIAKNKMLDCQSKSNEATDPEEKKKYAKLAAKYETEQLALKVAANSLYGGMGNQYFRYFDIRLAEAITLSGQLAIRWIENCLNDYLNKLCQTENHNFVVAGDTDSGYLTLAKLVEIAFKDRETPSEEKIVNFIDKFCQQKLEPYIEKMYQKLHDATNDYQNRMVMKREVIASRGIWTAKKRYVLNVHDSEGIRYKEPKMKMMGMEPTRSSTPYICREKLREAILLVLTTDEETVQQFIGDFRKEFFQAAPEEIASPRGVNNLDKYKSHTSIYTKGTPIAVRGALLFNHHIRQKQLDKRYEIIQEGDKIKFVYLTLPNPIMENIISFPTRLPTELNLDKYVDYSLQFEKAFLDPLQTIMQTVGWNHEKVETLESFFE